MIYLCCCEVNLDNGKQDARKLGLSWTGSMQTACLITDKNDRGPADVLPPAPTDACHVCLVIF